MHIPANPSLDVAQLVLFAFVIFFVGLVLYLRREDKREGYPLLSEEGPLQGQVEGYPAFPGAKRYPVGHTPQQRTPERALDGLLVRAGGFDGAPYEPVGNPLQDGVGPAAYAMRADVPDLTFDDRINKIVPLRAAPGFFLAEDDPDPRGMPVVCADAIIAGTVVDAWVDRSEIIVRYLEAEVAGTVGTRRVVFPMSLARVDGKHAKVRVISVTAAQFAAAPTIALPEQITLREEDRVQAYFAGGHMYATADRLGPLL